MIPTARGVDARRSLGMAHHQAPNPNLVCSLDALAERLGVSRAWLRRELRAGRLPSLKAGARRLYNVEAVAAALAERAAEGASR